MDKKREMKNDNKLMIYISCSEEQYKLVKDDLCNNGEHCYFGGCGEENLQTCAENKKNRIKHINTDITPEKPNYKTEAENIAYLQGFNAAVKKNDKSEVKNNG